MENENQTTESTPSPGASCFPHSDMPQTGWHAEYLKASDRAMQMEIELNKAFRLLRVIEEGHRNINSRSHYLACDTDPCEWCLKVRPLLLLTNASGDARRPDAPLA